MSSRNPSLTDRAARRLRNFKRNMPVRVGPRGAFLGLLFLVGLLLGAFVLSVWILNAPWWFALFMAGLTVLLVAALRWFLMSG